MIQKILDAISDLKGSYTDIIEVEKILKMLLTFMVIDEVFAIRREEGGVAVEQNASKFLNYVNEQLDLYVEDKDVKLFLFSTIALQYFLDSKRIMDSQPFNLLFFEGSSVLFESIRQTLKPQLIECFRNTELFFKGVENEKV